MLQQRIHLQGERVSLLPLDADTNLDELFQAANDERIWTYMPGLVSRPEQLRAIVDQAMAEREKGLEYPFVAFDHRLNRLVGSTRFLAINLPNRHLEIGWTWYSPEVWRTRVNTECKYLLLTYCFEEMGLIRVQLKADIRNERSNRAIARIGAVQEGELRQDRILPDGFRRNSYMYSILDTEWPEVKRKLESLLAEGDR